MKKAFTITELLVAMALLAAVLTTSVVIFNYSIDAQRTAMATAEIMRKLRAVTDQLNSDFAGLRKDGEIFVIWAAEPDGYKRFDRIMFFANGDFQSYGTPVIRGNVARISYMLAKRKSVPVTGQPPEKRILARTQHILTAGVGDDPTAFSADPNEWFKWNNRDENDRMTIGQWLKVPWNKKADMLSVVTDIRVDSSVPDNHMIGADVDPNDPNSIHMFLCEGIGEFKVQGWYAPQKRWVPEVDPDGDGDLGDSDFFIKGGTLDSNVPGVLYPYPPNGVVKIRTFSGDYSDLLNEEKFNSIPGLGPALKFTFTLYDSRGIIKNGRRFEHIVYIGN